jgi:hypothetical protein
MLRQRLVSTRLLPCWYFQSEAAMHITSSAVGGSAHLLSDATHAQTEQAQPHTSDGPQPPPTKGSVSLIGFVPPGGLHPVAGLNTAANEEVGKQPKGKGFHFEANLQVDADGTARSIQGSQTGPTGGLHPLAGGQVTTTAKSIGFEGLFTPTDAVVGATGNGHEGGGTSEGGGVFGPIRALRDKMLGGGDGPKPA